MPLLHISDVDKAHKFNGKCMFIELHAWSVLKNICQPRNINDDGTFTDCSAIHNCLTHIKVKVHKIITANR